ncbi:hypothetical protein LCGC14_1109220 [marine sediment metagenome]|uniref:Uncharacterized protein n=1 Tax=marine sediment metagenome TaxID=412755 RepID=A0A0F9PQF2_9ZZZZ
MGYLFLAVVFYTVVKFSVDVWLQFRYETQENRHRAFPLKTEYPDS